MMIHFDDQPILQDFDRFLDYFGEKETKLTADKAVLRGPDTLALNERMTNPVRMVKSRTPFQAFSLLNAFFYTAIAAKMFIVEKDSIARKSSMTVDTDRVGEYDRLSPKQKYFMLLEGFYWRMDWDLAYDCRSFWDKEFYRKILGQPVGKPVTIADGDLKRKGKIQPPIFLFFPEVLEAFGFFDLEWDTRLDKLEKRPSKYAFPYSSLTMNTLGQQLMPVLFGLPPYSVNAIEPILRDDDESFWDKLEQDGGEKETDFYNAFLPVIGGDAIEESFFVKNTAPFSGRVTLKIALDKKLYRTVELSSELTLHDLHGIIQKLYKFDDDHLYAFYMDGNPRSFRLTYSGSPIGEFPDMDGYDATQFTLGEVGLYAGKEFLYHFDFGADWMFHVRVLSIEEGSTGSKKHKLIETVGDAPEQYPDW